ncbi:hypothetical protein MASR2M78_32920 [Treponema sp.]
MMNEIPGIFASFAAGLLSFLSPCVLPLVPSYLAMLAGTSLKDLRSSTGDTDPSLSMLEDQERLKKIRWNTLRSSLAFTAGFSIVFIVLGIILSSASSMIGSTAKIWGTIAGIIVILLGLNIAFDFIKVLNIEKRMHFSHKPVGLIQATLFGAAFAAGWSPCVGPILASILLLAGRASLVQASILLASYSLGLALPFILAGAFFSRMEGFLNSIKKHMRLVKYVSGLLLVAVGASMLFSDLRSLSASFSRLGYVLSELSGSALLLARLMASLVYAFIAFLFFRFFQKKRAGGEAKQSSTTKKDRTLKNKLPLIGLVVFIVVFLLEALGLISSAQIISSWLLFQGI